MAKGRKPLSKKTLRYVAANKRKGDLLHHNFHKAYRLLCRKIIKAYFILRGDDVCFRCGLPIHDIYHIDHKEPWMAAVDPWAAYFDLRNITMSHPVCNSLARRKSHDISEIMKERAHKNRGSNGRFKKGQKS